MMCGDQLVLVADHGVTYTCARDTGHDGPHMDGGMVWTEGRLS